MAVEPKSQYLNVSIAATALPPRIDTSSRINLVPLKVYNLQPTIRQQTNPHHISGPQTFSLTYMTRPLLEILPPRKGSISSGK